jgi:hypothetical protein
MAWRGWDGRIKHILKEHELNNEMESAVGLASHPLTFPLTLGRHMKHFMSNCYKNGVADKRTFRICCVGARAECTLPDVYWREFLVISSACHLQDKLLDSLGECSYDKETNLPTEWIIDFVGPDVPKQLQSKTISLLDNQEKTPFHPQTNLTMNYHTSFLHELVLQKLKQMHKNDTEDELPSTIDRLKTIRQYWDGFVLFNPGLGHPNLSVHWESTIKFLLRTEKPILLTAHSTKDAHRDLAVMRNTCTQESLSNLADTGIEYQSNPYASRMQFVDPFATDTESVHVVRPNHSVLLLNSMRT